MKDPQGFYLSFNQPFKEIMKNKFAQELYLQYICFMKTKKEIVTSLLENKHITFDEALTLLEKDYNPSNFIGYPTYTSQPGNNNPYVVTFKSDFNKKWSEK